MAASLALGPPPSASFLATAATTTIPSLEEDKGETENEMTPAVLRRLALQVRQFPHPPTHPPIHPPHPTTSTTATRRQP